MMHVRVMLITLIGIAILATAPILIVPQHNTLMLSSANNQLQGKVHKACIFEGCITCIEMKPVHAVDAKADDMGVYAYARATGCICIPSNARIYDTDHGHDWWIPKTVELVGKFFWDEYDYNDDRGDRYAAYTLVVYRVDGGSELRVVFAEAEIYAPPKCAT